MRLIFRFLQTLIRPSVTWSTNRLSIDQWILRQVLKFKPRHAKHHAKHNRWYRYVIMWPIITVLLITNGSPLFVLTDVYLLTIVFSERGRLQMASVFVWPSDAVLVFTLRRYIWFSGSWQLPRCWFGCVVSQADWLLYNNSPSDIQ